MDVECIAALTGPITDEQLRYVDCYVAEGVGLFLPVGGACFQALTPDHSHPSYMFVLNFDDRTTMIVGGRAIVGEPGRVSYLSPGIPHHELPSVEPPRYIATCIEPALFERELGRYPGARDVRFEGRLHDASPELLPVLRRFMIEADNGAAGSEAVLGALGVELCHALIRPVFGLRAPHDRVSARMEVDLAIEYMHAHMGDKVSAGDLASRAHMSASHFSRVFRDELGCSPMAYLRRLRLERAKRLLVAGDLTVTQIALVCGFGSGAYLSSAFREAFGLPPSAYRDRVGGTGTRAAG